MTIIKLTDMKRLFFVLAILSTAVSCSVKAPEGTALFDYYTYEGCDDFYAQNPLPDDDYVYNPILAGWYSDPSICSNGQGDYFLVTSTFVYFPGVPLFHSRDLVNWEQIGNVLDRPSQLPNLDGQRISGGIYAPDIQYNPANKTYYMITTDVAKGNFYVKTQDPWGDWSDPIYVPVVKGIDPSFFFDDNGKAYIVSNDVAPDGKEEYSGHRTIRCVEFDVENDCTVGDRVIIVNKGSRPERNPYWIEGPHLYKINGTYYLMCAEGGTNSENGIRRWSSRALRPSDPSSLTKAILSLPRSGWTLSVPTPCPAPAMPTLSRTVVATGGQSSSETALTVTITRISAARPSCCPCRGPMTVSRSSFLPVSLYP